ncbi:tetratricopeptide repeat protein [Phenylobacterium sp.]|uniref:tetratricopeptide repeat protein n=1 Tax=Phenylobacterium sp. TaxID=1871053 RepID=UPI002733C518|nr:tetratricopeptide repeat protein [Phenylobacterium sp.]MDP3854166.1 tetratricopeptide repeat protein [Phenylobacterium sp.]
MQRSLVSGAILAAVVLCLPTVGACAERPRSTDRQARFPTGAAQAAAFRRGMSSFQRKDYASAIPAFDEAIRLQPEFAVAIAQRGFAHIEVGNYGLAISDHDTVLKLASDSPQAWVNSCWARAVANSELDQALALCDRAVALRPDVSALDSRGFVRFRRGEFALAISDYTAAILSSRSGSSLFMRGVAKSRMGSDAGGLADIRWARRIDPGVADRYSRFGVAMNAK